MWNGVGRDGYLHMLSCFRIAAAAFEAELYGSPDLWIVMFHGGPQDIRSSEHKINFLRLAADMEGSVRAVLQLD